MNQNSEIDDDLRLEYDFMQMTIVASGQGRQNPTVSVVHPDQGDYCIEPCHVTENVQRQGFAPSKGLINS